MSEENSGAPQVKMSVLAQFVRDMSFENMVAQKGIASIKSLVSLALTLRSMGVSFLALVCVPRNAGRNAARPLGRRQWPRSS